MELHHVLANLPQLNASSDWSYLGTQWFNTRAAARQVAREIRVKVDPDRPQLRWRMVNIQRDAHNGRWFGRHQYRTVEV